MPGIMRRFTLKKLFLIAAVSGVSLASEENRKGILQQIQVYGDTHIANVPTFKGSVRDSSYTTQPVNLNEATVNYAMFRFLRDENKWRAGLGIHGGYYVRVNYANEATSNALLERAHLGFKLFENIWLDAGLFESHIGNEGAIHFDLPTLTRSLIGDLSPYYQNQIRLGYESAKLTAKLVFMNGWQKIVGYGPAGGWMFSYMPFSSLSLNSNSYFGVGSNTESVRYFHNFWLGYDLTKDLNFKLTLDIGAEQDQYRANQKALGFGGFSFISQYIFNSQWAVSLRLEGYDDRRNIFVRRNLRLLATPYYESEAAFQVLGTSVGVDFKPVPELMVRAEVRYLRSFDPFFTTSLSNSQSNLEKLKLQKDEMILSLSLAGYLWGVPES